MIRLQHTLRNNQRDVQSYFEDLDQWTQEVANKNPKQTTT